ncbi:MAG: 30S ribosomal protein S7 [Vampirovibrio sp.]|nr:30S ribosomal protein S7 [Vampirovibrio sp.]
MPRRYKPARRIPDPDPVFQDVEVAKFINRLMLRGKKSTAERIFYETLKAMDGKTDKPSIEVFHEALKKVRPLVKVKARRVGGSTYQVPMEVREYEGVAIGTRWLITYARARKGRSMVEKLSSEMLDAYNGTGAAVKKREDTHRMAEANKAFAHYRF